MEKLLRKLVDAPSISGKEGDVRDAIKKELRPHVDDVRVDRIGNLIARKGKGSPKIMVVAHMDQIGLMVKHIDDKGFIRFEPVGGWDQKILPGQKVLIHGSKGNVVGVIGSKPLHLQEKEELSKPIKMKELFIDIGAGSSKDVEKAGVSEGDFIIVCGEFSKLRGSKVTGYGFDNRLGCTVLVEAVKRLKNFKGTLYAVGSVQEEIGLIGVRGSAFGVDPDVVLGIDVTIAGDMPEVKPEEAATESGKGPILIVKDAVSIIHPQVKMWVSETAKKNKIKIQHEVTGRGATDSSITPTIRDGIPSGGLGIATRYLHTPVEVCDMNDVKDCVNLVVKLVESAGRYF